jgi:hypothetical protein
MAFKFGMATTAEEKEAVYRFRYSVYVREMGRYQDTADHERGWLREPEDDNSRIFYALEDDKVVATSRLTWGGDGGFSERQIEQYALARFIAELGPEKMAVGERAMIVPRLRGTDLLTRMMGGANGFVAENGIWVIFGACEPHLLTSYLGMGNRTYAEQNINSKEAGYLIPLISFPNGPEALRDPAIGQWPSCIEDVLSAGGAVTSRLHKDSEDYWSEIQSALHELEGQKISALDGLAKDEADRVLSKSNIIECNAGDRILKKGGVARNIFVVLEGTLEARNDDRIVGVLTAGDVFGEMAFLLSRPRTLDVYAATDDARILSLSESTIRRMIRDDSVVAAKMLLNISRMLCVRLLKAN